MRLIDANNVRDLFDAEFKETRKLILAGETHLDNLAEGFTEADRVIRQMPTVDAEVVMHGRWDDSGRYTFSDGSVAVRCSECGCALTESEYAMNNWNFCPVCGAKMDGGNANATD